MKNIHVLPTEKPSAIGYHFDIVKTGSLDFAPNFGFKKFDTKNNFQHRPHNIYITSDEEIKDKCYVLSDTSIGALYLDGVINTALMLAEGQWKKVVLTTDQDLIKDGVQAIDDEFLEWFVKNPSCEEVKVVYEPKNFLDTRQGWEYTIILKIPEEDWLLNNPHCKQIESCSKSLSKKCICPKEEPTIEKEYLKDELKKYDGIGVVVLNKPEEPKQETLEEVAIKFAYMLGTKDSFEYIKSAFVYGAKWQADKVFNDDAIQTLEKALAILLKRQESMYSEKEVELIANEMVNWAIDNVGNPNPQSGRKFDEVISKFKKK